MPDSIVAPPPSPVGTGPMSGPQHVSDDPNTLIRAGLLALLVLVGGFGGWAATAQLASAVIAHGTVVVDSNVKKVQHPTGGIVGDIRVRDGDRVAAGDLLVRLDETITRANLQILKRQLAELVVRQARLKAERDGAASVNTPTSTAGPASLPEFQEILAGEQSLFESRRLAREGQKAQFNERVAQLFDQIAGLQAQAKAKSRELELVSMELRENEVLWKKNLTPLSKRIALQREAARVEGDLAQITAASAQAKTKIAETRLQIIQLDQDLRAEVTKDLREAQAKDAELNERRVAAEDQLRRVDIRAPQAGIVHQMSVHTVGGVVTASEPIMLIVPWGDALVIEAKIAPQDIDHVRSGQVAVVRFPAFNQRTTPEFAGEVQRVAADLTREPQLNQAYFVTRISLPKGELSRMGALTLVPGMPAEIHIRTGERTALSYLMKPLTDQIARAFTER